MAMIFSMQEYAIRYQLIQREIVMIMDFTSLVFVSRTTMEIGNASV